MNIPDDIYMGSFYGANGVLPIASSSADPTVNNGVGPMGRIAFRNIVPLTLGTANAAVLQALTAATAMTLAAGTGVTSASAPDGSGRTVMLFDVPRAVSLTSVSNLSAISFTITGFDIYGRLQTQTRVGPNNNTVNTLKAFQSVLSVVPASTSASTMSVGTSDIFGLNFTCADAGYIMPKWNNTLAQDAGTFVAADATSPATVATGDPRGTYVPSSASDGSKRLVIWQHLIANQCGPNATVVGAIGVTPA